MGRGGSKDPRQLCAQAENGQAGRGSYLEAAVGETVSPVVEAECGDAGSAAVVTPPGQAGRDPNEGEEQLATPGDESGDAEEESAMDAPGDGAVPTVGDAGLGGEAAGRFVRVAQGVERPDRAIGSGGETGRRTTSPGPVVDDAAWSGTGDGPGFCADHRGCGTLCRQQAAHQLSGPGSQRTQLGQQASAGSHYQARQLFSTQAAGGGGADHSTQGRGFSQRVSIPLP